MIAILIFILIICAWIYFYAGYKQELIMNELAVRKPQENKIYNSYSANNLKVVNNVDEDLEDCIEDEYN